MKERVAVTVICIVLLIVGFYTVFTFFTSSFTFSKSEISLENGVVTEKLTFEPKESYRTLYRNFVSPLFLSSPGSEAIIVSSIKCSSGDSYAYTIINGCFTGDLKSIECYPNTELNEVGCTYGTVWGFKKNKDYTLTTTYSFFTPAIIEINNNNYRKLVLYSSERHPILRFEDNFIVNIGGAIVQYSYFPFEDVIVYIPYNDEVYGGEIIYQSAPFEPYWKRFGMLFLLGIFPAVFFFIVWWFCGKERFKVSLPDQMSFFPDTKRRGWEVATFFNSPFGSIDKKFFAATLLDLYHRKIIQIKTKDKKAWIKLPKSNFKDADTVERRLIKILVDLDALIPETHRDAEGFAELKKLLSYANKKRSDIRSLQRYIKERSKKYIDYKVEKTMAYIGPVVYILASIGKAKKSLTFLIGLVILFWFYVILLHHTAVLIRFKKDYYKEYRHWQAFKKWLSKSFSMKHSESEAVILWDKYLVYATALGVSGKIIKRLRQLNVISDIDYIVFNSVVVSSSAFVGGGGVGGGVGSVGGGGAGGGGGGGR